MSHTAETSLQKKVLLISCICLAGAAVSAQLLYQDLTLTGQEGKGSPIAEVTRLEARVRRKAMGAFNWTNLVEMQPLFQKDSVQTGPGSAASIRLKDGSILELGEQSLIVLDDSRELALQFVQGTGVIHGTDGDAKISVDQNGQTRVEKLPIRLLVPEPLAEYYLQDSPSLTVPFQWNAKTSSPGDSKTLHLEISSTDRFRKNQSRTLPVTGTGEWNTSLDLKPGRYFWRILQDGEPVGTSRSFKVSQAVPLQPASPAPQELISRFGSEGPISFRWLPREESSRGITHSIQLSSDPSFGTKIREEKVAPESGTVTLPQISQGEVFWRMVAHFPGKSIPGSTQRFRIERKSDLSIALLAPADRSPLESRPELRFAWRSDPLPDLEYTLEVRRNQGGKLGEVVHSDAPRTSSAIWREAPPGVYQWQVTARLNGQVIGSSLPRVLVIHEGKPIALREPSDRKSFLFWEKPESFEFQWEDQGLAGEYRLEIAEDLGFNSITVTHPTRARQVRSGDLALKPGKYFWRVRQVDSDGTALKVSKVFSFEYDHYPTLPSPTTLTPEAGRAFNPLKNDENPTLKWKAVSQATGYEVTIRLRELNRTPSQASETEFRKVIVKDSELELPDLTVEGDYFWTVRTIDRLGRLGDPSPVREFKFTYGARLKAPKLTAPEIQ